ncbi:SAM-dependent methyltransferase [Streptacidiphilus sp. N1-12]|uniref:SAM-dependent methyltransferase n=2 Tax=Streptacidiphilus alkalitolerans TaxID=3342712 RepID=A0ABV6VG43_9ACTN
MSEAAEGFRPPTDLRPDIPHPARIYDWLLGGKDNFPADREAGARIVAADPAMRVAARANRAFLQRAVRHAAAEQGVDQFLDIGTGIPAAGNTHQIAQGVNPQARVMYVDNDPIVLTHARALMAGPGHGETRVLQADLREPKRILGDPDVRALLDFDRPVALLLVAILHFIADEDDPFGIVAELMAALAPGSLLVLSHGTADFISAEVERRVTSVYERSPRNSATGRSHSTVSRFFDGLELLPPGLVTAPFWHPEEPTAPEDARLPLYAAVARKP